MLQITERMSLVNKKVNDSYKSYNQLKNKLDAFYDRENNFKLNILNYERTVISLNNKQNLYKCFTVLISQHDVSRLKQLVQIN